MMLRIQKERMNAAYFPSAEESYRPVGTHQRTFRESAGAASGIAILHPGPMNRGLELCAEAADSQNAWVLRQVSNGVAVRMAVLYLLLTDGSSEKTILRRRILMHIRKKEYT